MFLGFRLLLLFTKTSTVKDLASKISYFVVKYAYYLFFAVIVYAVLTFLYLLISEPIQCMSSNNNSTPFTEYAREAYNAAQNSNSNGNRPINVTNNFNFDPTALITYGVSLWCGCKS